MYAPAARRAREWEDVSKVDRICDQDRKCEKHDRYTTTTYVDIQCGPQGHAVFVVSLACGCIEITETKRRYADVA
jgi:hypothetical protein